jgi:hypothetical protein
MPSWSGHEQLYPLYTEFGTWLHSLQRRKYGENLECETTYCSHVNTGTTASSRGCTEMSGRVVSIEWIGEDLEGSSDGLIWGNVPLFALRYWRNHPRSPDQDINPKANVKQFLCGPGRLWGFQEVKGPRFHGIRLIEVIRLSDLHTSRLYHTGNIPGTHFC